MFKIFSINRRKYVTVQSANRRRWFIKLHAVSRTYGVASDQCLPPYSSPRLGLAIVVISIAACISFHLVCWRTTFETTGWLRCTWRRIDSVQSPTSSLNPWAVIRLNPDGHQRIKCRKLKWFHIPNSCCQRI